MGVVGITFLKWPLNRKLFVRFSFCASSFNQLQVSAENYYMPSLSDDDKVKIVSGSESEKLGSDHITLLGQAHDPGQVV